MKVKVIKAWHQEFPMRFVFKHALAERSTSSSIITRIELENQIIGFGECLPRPYVTGETVESCLKIISQELGPKLLAHDFNNVKDIKMFVLGLHDNPETGKNLAAICAIELALIDAFSKHEKKNIYQFLELPAQKKSIEYSMIVSTENEEKIKKYTTIAKRLWIKNLKLKVTNSISYNENVLQIMKKYYPKSIIRVDANCIWTVDEAIEQISMMKKHNIVSCEQPTKKEDFQALAQLVKRFPEIKICVDESLCSFADAKTLIDNKSTTLLNIRISKNGGIFNSLRIYNYAKKNGIQSQLGAQVGETAILSFFGRIFAAITGDLKFHEGSFGPYLLKEDIVKKKFVFGCRGKANTVFEGYGNPLKIDETIIEKYQVTTP